ncbi:MAG: AzlD domain-containing protein [Chloroflexi bacterium]|nr:AzlD domain-containing protein [Chloroflexota bacterium]
MEIWLTMLFAGLLTFGLRFSFIALYGRLVFPDWVIRALRYVPPAVLSAIVFPELFLTGGELNLSLANFRLIAGVLAALVAWRTRSILWTILAGMAALALLQTIFLL